jgi:hypothetical protein
MFTVLNSNMRRLFDACYDFLCAYCLCNREHQAQIVKYRAVFEMHVRHGFGSARIFAVMLRDNRVLCRDVPREHVDFLLQSISQFGLVPELLEPLLCAMKANGVLFRANQATIVSCLMHSARFAMPLVISSGDCIDAIIALVRQTPGSMVLLREAIRDEWSFTPAMDLARARAELHREPALRSMRNALVYYARLFQVFRACKYT